MHVFLSYGFRPFFTFAALFAIASVWVWLALLGGILTLPLAGLPGSLWHAHEMLFGYASAVIAGFLLTAVRNWTQLPGLEGRGLALLLLCWLVPRILFVLPLPANIAGLIAAFDLIFLGVLTVVVARPIVASGQLQRQAGIVAKLVLLGLSHVLFYVALFLGEFAWVQTSLYSALYLIVALCLTLSRRLLPFFVKSSTGIELANSDILDRSSLFLFFAFWLSIIVWGHTWPSAVLSGLLVLVHSARLWLWRIPDMQRIPLLWVLYLAYTFFILGFLLLALTPLFNLAISSAVHAFAVGGIGLLTLGMMSRVAWGHTGRAVARPPRIIAWIFAALVVSAVCRVAGVELFPQLYLAWIEVAAIAWVLAFAAFLLVYAPVLFGPRADDN